MAGVDEVGRGALAGPVVAAAVVLPLEPGLADQLSGVRDSKLVEPSERERLALVVKAAASDCAVGWSSAAEIDAVGIGRATDLAILRALNGLRKSGPPDRVLVDGRGIKLLRRDVQVAVVRGDSTVLSIAAASLLAKVTRDAAMIRLGLRWPRLKLDEHKGYGTPAHLRLVHLMGPTEEHRLTWRPIANLHSAARYPGRP